MFQYFGKLFTWSHKEVLLYEQTVRKGVYVFSLDVKIFRY